MKAEHLVIFILSILSFVANATEIFNSNVAPSQKRTFEIDGSGFLMDGKPFRYISGTLHYFRVHQSSWRDRLRKMKYAGLNAVQTYSIWSSHEPEIGKYKFDGNLDIVKFIGIAQEEGLYVILRPGPYIDAEVDMGGLPYWLLREKPDIKLRTYDLTYIYYVEIWLNVILQQIKPLLYQYEGPIIMVQIENEYGSFGACDFRYTAFLRDLTKSALGDEVVLFTTDGASANYLKCGKISGVYATVDFGTLASIEHSFKAQRLFEPTGPLVNSEFYTGWLDHWGHPHSTVDGWVFAYYLDQLLSLGASVNMYVFNGGTSFGMLSGSNIIYDKFVACPTSYDYDAPMNEAGDPTTKYHLIRNITAQYTELPSGDVPPASPKFSYGKVKLRPIGSLKHLLKSLAPTPIFKNPPTFEEQSVPNGIIAYQSIFKHSSSDPSPLAFPEIKDRAYIFVDANYIGLVTREQKILSLGIHAQKGQLLTIIVESMGRNCFGEQMNDWKGFKKVTLSGIELSDWVTTPLNLDDSEQIDGLLANLKTTDENLSTTSVNLSRMMMMSFFEGEFEINLPAPRDTYLKLDIWSKGYAWVNGFLLGRYWPLVGPQETLYVPAGILRRGKNTVRIFEMEEIRANCANEIHVQFVDSPIINASTPYYL